MEWKGKGGSLACIYSVRDSDGVHGEEPPGMKGCVESLLPFRL